MRVETPDDSSAAAGFYALKDLESGSDSYVEVRQGDADADHDETDSTNSSDNEESLLRHGRRPRQRSAPRCESSMLQKRRRCNALYGPRTPRQFRIVPVLETLQTAPLRLVDRVLPTRKHRWAALILLHLLWGAIFLTILHRSVVGPEMGEYGTPVRLSCRARLWGNSTDCGVDGRECQPFADAALAFRCPAGCLDTTLLEPYTVGDQELNYQPLVVGGAPFRRPENSNIEEDEEKNGSYYRGDSFICASALHAGVISNAVGGCGVIRRLGERSGYGNITRNGIASTAFDSNFPLAYTFEQTKTTCPDQRWLLFGISVLFTVTVSLFTTSPAAFYVSVYLIVYLQVALASDPPYAMDYLEVVSIGMGRFLPAAFVGWAIYHFCARDTLTGLTAQFEKTILWLGPCWVGALNTDTFDRIPISRLTPHDIQQQPGAIPALIIIVSIIIVCATAQAWCIWAAGKLPRFLALYAAMAAALLVMTALPQLHLRIHHYILALLFLPGTALQTRPSLVYQGLLVGLFINGVARWGFDSILQTPAALLGDAQLGSALPNVTVTAIDNANRTISFALEGLHDAAAGVAVLVNDVMRLQVFRPSDDVGRPLSVNWTQLRDGEKEYFRFGFVRTSPLGGMWYEDFTKPGIWHADGQWTHMEPGPS